MDLLTAKLKKLEKQNYRAYQQIKGSYDFGDFDLHIDHVQSDPYATPSRFRAFRPWSLTGLQWLQEKSSSYQIAARDFIARSFAEFAKAESSISIALTGQIVVDNTAVVFTELGIEIRFRVNLPADGRNILAKKALNSITFYLPKFIRKATIDRELDLEKLKLHCETIEDQQAIREQLSEAGLIGFVGNGSVLPRSAGNSEFPMKNAVPFQTPDSLKVQLSTPNQGTVTGMGIKEGVTLIVGGGFHGKSTLLAAIENAFHNHIPGDGREFTVSTLSTMKIRAEEGRPVHNLNLSNFINHLPMGKDTQDFTTQDASGSTSQAAWLQESIEAGAQCLLIDEDTSATNFMIRDERMQALVSKGSEPITPLVDRVKQLHSEASVSTVIVMGGSGDYLDVADCVIQMHDYQALDVTDKAKAVIAQHPTRRVCEAESDWQSFKPRTLNTSSILSILQEGKFRVSAKGIDSLRIGKEFIDLSAVEQLKTSNEINAIGWCLFNLAQTPAWTPDTIKKIEALLELDDWHTQFPNLGDLAKPRTVDVMSALNRLRKVQFSNK
jgi:predicted ABC-class ATPase